MTWGHAVAENRFFHRSPRKLKAPQMSVVAIEHPPVRQVVEKKPAFYGDRTIFYDDDTNGIRKYAGCVQL